MVKNHSNGKRKKQRNHFYGVFKKWFYKRNKRSAYRKWDTAFKRKIEFTFSKQFLSFLLYPCKDS